MGVVPPEIVVKILGVDVVVPGDPADTDLGIEQRLQLLPERDSEIAVSQDDNTVRPFGLAGQEQRLPVPVRVAVDDQATHVTVNPIAAPTVHLSCLCRQIDHAGADAGDGRAISLPCTVSQTCRPRIAPPAAARSPGGVSGPACGKRSATAPMPVAGLGVKVDRRLWPTSCRDRMLNRDQTSVCKVA